MFQTTQYGSADNSVPDVRRRSRGNCNKMSELRSRGGTRYACHPTHAGRTCGAGCPFRPHDALRADAAGRIARAGWAKAQV